MCQKLYVLFRNIKMHSFVTKLWSIKAFYDLVYDAPSSSPRVSKDALKPGLPSFYICQVIPVIGTGYHMILNGSRIWENRLKPTIVKKKF